MDKYGLTLKVNGENTIEFTYFYPREPKKLKETKRNSKIIRVNCCMTRQDIPENNPRNREFLPVYGNYNSLMKTKSIVK